MLCAILVLLVFLCSGTAELVPTPIRFQRIQCGCSNERLQALAPSSTDKTQVVLTGFFSFPSTSACNGNEPASSTITSYLIPAALIALDEINNSSDILQGYHLTLDVRDSRCDSTHAITELSDSIVNEMINPPSNSFNFGIIGPGCTSVTRAVAGVVGRSVRLPVVSYGLNSPVMRERMSFPTLFNVARSLVHTMNSAIKLMKHFNWTTNSAFISEDSNDLFLSTLETVLTQISNDIHMLNDGGDTSINVSEFSKIQMGSNVPNAIKSFLQSVRQKHIRVILGLLSQRLAAQLICTARSGVIPGNGFVFVLVGTYSENWWQTETSYCSLTDDDVKSVVIVSGEVINPNINATLQSGRSVHDFKEEYNQRLRAWCNDSVYLRSALNAFSGTVYDAVWALALALNESADTIDSAVDRGLHYDPETLRRIVYFLKAVNFSGVTGQVLFKDGEIVGADSVQQIQSGSQVLVGYLDRQLLTVQAFVWNVSNTIPSENLTIVEKSIDTYLLVIASVFTVFGMIFGITMLVFNWHHASHRILRASSQRLNYVIIIGVFFGYFSVLIQTVFESHLGTEMSPELFKALCLIRIWMLPLAFTFTYGILFARAWRIYRVFHNPWASSRPYKDHHLMLMVMLIVVGDMIILIPWTIIDPYRRFPVETGIDYASFTRCLYFGCSSTNALIWLGVLAGYKIIIIIVGIIVITLVRKEVRERKIFDDSRSLAAAVYISAVSFVVGLGLTILFLRTGRPVLSYTVSSIWVNISSSATLICIFIPKTYRIVIKKDSGSRYRKARRLYYGEYTTTIKTIGDRPSPSKLDLDVSVTDECHNEINRNESTDL